MRSKKLFFISVVLFVLISYPSVGASSEMWSQIYESARHGCAYSVVETSDGGYAIAGESDVGSDFCLLKTDEGGNMQWNKTYGGTNADRAFSVVETSDGGYALAGYTESFGAGSFDCWLVKTDVDGNMLWNRAYGGPDSEKAYSVVKASDGGYAMFGDGLLIKTDEYGYMVWNQTYGGGMTHGLSGSLAATSDGGYAFVLGSQLTKTDAQGNVEWSQTYDGEGATDRELVSVVETSDGGYTAVGHVWFFLRSGSPFIWAVKTDEYGVIPEFPSWTPLLITLIAVVAVAVIYRRKIHKHNQRR